MHQTISTGPVQTYPENSPATFSWGQVHARYQSLKCVRKNTSKFTAASLGNQSFDGSVISEWHSIGTFNRKHVLSWWQFIECPMWLRCLGAMHRVATRANNHDCVPAGQLHDTGHWTLETLIQSASRYWSDSNIFQQLNVTMIYL